jgi:hypothetical protein
MIMTRWISHMGRVALLAALLLPAHAWGQASCNGLIQLTGTTSSGINFALPGTVVHIHISIGTGAIQAGTSMSVSHLRFDQACDIDQPFAVGCGADLPAPITYNGDATLSDNCPGVTFTSNAPAGGNPPNTLVFTPNVPLVIPANSFPFCQLDFDVTIIGRSTDSTPNSIEVDAGYLGTDALCNNGLRSIGSQSAQVPLCPICLDDECNTSACNQETGQCVLTPRADSTPCADMDANACTFAGCEAGVCVQPHVVTVCTPDNNDCTSDPPCDPATGACVHPALPDSTACADTDQNACTTAGCEAGTCVQPHIVTVCTPDTNECTSDPACNPATGLCLHPPLADSTPCTDSDGNACNTAGCEAGQCVQTHVVTVCTPDTNECTDDLPCNPTTGQCVHPPKADSTPCTDTDRNACTNAGCESGQCVQAHVRTVCTADTNPCTLDPACNTATGTCDHPNAPDSTPCPDTVIDDCQAGCEAGQCVPTHVCIPPAGCRVTAGGVNPNGGIDTGNFAGSAKGTFGGQVGSPCGCIGCFDDFDHIHGNWQYSRKTQLGKFHAKNFNSLVCGCEDLAGHTIDLDGRLCGNREIGPTPPAAPANVACFSGQGGIAPLSVGKTDTPVAFRIEVEDRGEPGGLGGSGKTKTPDQYRIRIWVPKAGESLDALVAGACCTGEVTNRAPDIDDGDVLTKGNMQIHPQIGDGSCPPPSGNCTD